MSASFYNYIVDSVLAPFFKSKKISCGNKYYMIVENKSKLSELVSAFKASSYFEPITINNIFNNGSLDGLIEEEPYHAMVSKGDDGCVKVIVANSEDACDDYLTTLRNAIASPESQYENYAVFYILSKTDLNH